MNAENAKNRLMKQRMFKSKVSKEIKRMNKEGTITGVENRMDIEALDFAINLINQYQRGKLK
jgi:hypothetical protein